MKPDIVAFMVRTPFTQRDYARFGIEVIKNEGCQVCVLDLTALLNPRYLKECSSNEWIEFDGLIKFRSKSEFKDFLKEKNKTIFVVDVIGAEFSNLFIYKYFKEFGVLYASFCANTVPMSSLVQKRSIFKIIKNKLPLICSRNFVNILRFLFLKETCRWLCRRFQSRGIIGAPDYVLAGGRKIIPKHPLPDKHTKTIWGHTLDFDILLQQSAEFDQENYVVFIDEYAPHTPDFIISPMSKINAEAYYGGLNKFFDWYEKKFDQKIVIAAHPRSRYDEKPQCFGARQIIKRKTAECIAKASCVFTHSSTAMNFAVYFRKPIFFLTSDGYQGTPLAEYVNSFAASLGQTPINVDRPLDDLDLKFNFNEEVYAQFSEDYIKTSGSPKKLFWKIVIDELNTIDQKVERTAFEDCGLAVKG